MMEKDPQKKRQNNEEFGHEFVDMNAAKMYEFPFAQSKNNNQTTDVNKCEKSRH